MLHCRNTVSIEFSPVTLYAVETAVPLIKEYNCNRALEKDIVSVRTHTIRFVENKISLWSTSSYSTVHNYNEWLYQIQNSTRLGRLL